MDENMKLLSLEDIIKALDEKGIEYDKREIEYPYFPLEDVEACLNNETEPSANQLPCPLCGKPSEELKWIHFKSPKWTRENLMGRGGPMSICPECGCIVEFQCFIMN